ncbi:hypothetical protein Clacol_005748 [Clathrus columnatus]|uniref:Deacetylase sirtuin-type domain-containing protein n=1 Tax=Clathrus columnatus TaxID=1419009 RepID=A0AAV5AHU4_9AGAM|nr:hypothetical protein Clacol_005748 [Clathrus columnatus]
MALRILMMGTDSMRKRIGVSLRRYSIGSNRNPLEELAVASVEKTIEHGTEEGFAQIPRRPIRRLSAGTDGMIAIARDPRPVWTSQRQTTPMVEHGLLDSEEGPGRLYRIVKRRLGEETPDNGGTRVLSPRLTSCTAISPMPLGSPRPILQVDRNMNDIETPLETSLFSRISHGVLKRPPSPAKKMKTQSQRQKENRLLVPTNLASPFKGSSSVSSLLSKSSNSNSRSSKIFRRSSADTFNAHIPSTTASFHRRPSGSHALQKKSKNHDDWLVPFLSLPAPSVIKTKPTLVLEDFDAVNFRLQFSPQLCSTPVRKRRQSLTDQIKDITPVPMFGSKNSDDVPMNEDVAVQTDYIDPPALNPSASCVSVAGTDDTVQPAELTRVFCHRDDAALGNSPTSLTETAASSQNPQQLSSEQDSMNLRTMFSGLDLTATSLWSNEDVRNMTRDAQEKGIDWWIKEYVVERQISPRKLLLAFGLIFSKGADRLDNDQIFRILKMTLMRIIRRRERLTSYNTIQDVVSLLNKSQRIMVLSGAGISVSSGIPDFRSKNGLYQMLKSTCEYQLDDPQQMFDLEYFKENPSVKQQRGVALPLMSNREIYPSNHEPSLAHRFIHLLETKNKLLRNYTQNIDDLESSAGIRRATCLQCGTQYPGKHIEKDVLEQRVPLCTKCPRPQPKPPKKRKISMTWNGGDETTSEEEEDVTPKAVIKPNITFFGEKLTDEFDELLGVDRTKVNLLIVMGTSLKVSNLHRKVTPVSEILSYIPHSVPQILINKTPIKHMNADIVLLGNADSIIEYLCTEALGPDWELPSSLNSSTSNGKRKSKCQPPRRVGNSHVWLFEGAEGGEFVANLEAQAQKSVAKHGNGKAAESSRQTKKQRTN